MVWVWRHQNKKKKYLSKNVKGKKRDGDISQMIWGCFAGNKLSPIVFVNDNITQAVYMRILKQNLMKYIEVLKEEGLNKVVFQQYNASSHTTKRTQCWLKNAEQEHEFILIR